VATRVCGGRRYRRECEGGDPESGIGKVEDRDINVIGKGEIQTERYTDLDHSTTPR
jgi:hypothetical protein